MIKNAQNILSKTAANAVYFAAPVFSWGGVTRCKIMQ
jgi:hypothetical protein